MTIHLRPSDPSVYGVKACRWRFKSHDRAIKTVALLSAVASLQLFVDAEEPALLAFALDADSGPALEPAALLRAPADAEAEWTEEADIVTRWSAGRAEAPGCLVVVRQPLVRPDSRGQRDWVSTVIRALDGDREPPEGLLTASFFASRDGATVLNFAEWTSAAAHRAVLARGRDGRHGSIGSTPLWHATRTHPAITAEHEVHRYLPATALSETPRAA